MSATEETKPDVHEDELGLDFEEDDNTAEAEKAAESKDQKKGSYTNLHTSSFKDFVLKPEVLRAITDCGFEHPSEVQHECIPQAILGVDVLCQAKSGMGKTAVFVLSVLHQMEEPKGVQCVVLAHTRDLALQISNEFERFSKYLPGVRVASIYGGVDISEQKALFADEEKMPNVICGSPGRVLALVRDGTVKLDNVKYFILDECDKMLEQLDMRRDVQEIFKKTPHSKQVMMFSATLSEKIRPVCKKFLRDPVEVFVDSESKLTLHGLLQYYVQVPEEKKLAKLTELLDALEFNQVIIFTKSVARATKLSNFLCEQNFPSIYIHSSMAQKERTSRYLAFKNFEKRILVSTDLFARGIDVERVNIVINFDMPQNSDTYLHRVGRAGRFGTKGLAITFVSSKEDGDVLNEVQSRFIVEVPELPETIDTESYMPSYDN